MNHLLSQLGLTGLAAIHANLSPALLYEHALRRREIELTADGAMAAKTGIHTGRSPHDKYVVRDAATENEIHWGKVNQPYDPSAFDRLQERITAWLQSREVFVQDLRAGAEDKYHLPIRVVTTNAWHSLFARNMFIRPDAQRPAADQPGFTIIHVPEFEALPERDQTHSGVFVIINFSKKLALIGGTSYAGEIKKCIFTVMNSLLPPQGVLPMHASANTNAAGEVAVFFGLSGTGKTTLSADPERTLIGDDEHGWSDDAVFNFEGGCYAKVIRLDPKAEPEITAASRRFGTVLENVVIDPVTRAADFDDAALAENSRASYPIDFIPNASPTGRSGVPRNIVMLTCDAYGVLPPVARLSAEQAMYHFLSGYTARVAGTEKGVTEPVAVFSTCFGAPFLPRPPEVYAKMLGEKITRHKVACWLVNTGWSGGGAGIGKRMPISITRALIHAILSGDLATADFAADPAFGLSIPTRVAGVPASTLTPREAWADKAAYDAAAKKLIGLFTENFKTFAGKVGPEIVKAGMTDLK